MKKSIKWVLAVLGVVVAGVVIGWASGSPNGIHVSEGAKYQYQLINPDDIIIEYSGLKPDSKLSKYKGKYVTDTAMYLSDEVGIYLGDEHFKAKVGEYIKYSDINWTWNLSDFEMYQLMNSQGEASPSLFKGVVVYSDGTEGDISADRVTLEPSADGSQIVVGVWFRGDIFYYKINIQERWGDGESLSEEEKETFKQEGSSGNNTDLKEDKLVYSESDAPGLSSINWGIVNKYYNEVMSSDIGTDVNVFKVIGKDPRINEDWSELNEKFDSLYGNDDRGVYTFLLDLYDSYMQSGMFVLGFADYAFLYIEPYRSNTDSGLYGEVGEDRVTDEEGYNKWLSEHDAGSNNVDDSSMDKTDELMGNTWEQQYRKELSRLIDEYITEEPIYDMDEVREAYDKLVSDGILSDPDGKYKEAIGY